MRDCGNGEIRDRLPLLVAGSLAPADREAVEAHVRGCADCRAEVELLHAVQRAHPAPAVDVAAIASRLPSRRSALAQRPFYRQPLWRAAAAITMLIAGAAATMLLRGTAIPEEQVVNRPGGNDTAIGAGDSSPDRLVAVAEPRTATPAIAWGVNLDGLSDEQLEALLGTLDRLEANVLAEPEVFAAPIVPVTPEPSGGRN